MPKTAAKQAQEAVAKAVNSRGYGKGTLTDEQYIAKQWVKLLEELLEMGALLNLPASGAPDAVKLLFRDGVKEEVKAWFHDTEYFERVEVPYSLRPFVDGEVFDLAVVLLNICEQSLGVDLVAGAHHKAKNDISRGVG